MPLEQAQWIEGATKLNARCSSDVVPRRDYVSVYAMAISADCCMQCAFGIRPSLPLGTWTKCVPSKNNRTRVSKQAVADSVPPLGRAVRRRLRNANDTDHDAHPSARSCSLARSSRQLSSAYSCSPRHTQSPARAPPALDVPWREGNDLTVDGWSQFFRLGHIDPFS